MLGSVLHPYNDGFSMLIKQLLPLVQWSIVVVCIVKAIIGIRLGGSSPTRG